MSDTQQRYRVKERLASGGMAEVFIAESAGIEGFKKQVAIKRVLPHLSEKKRFIAMFLDEARLSAHLTHSNVAQVFDIGVGDTAYFIVMEYVDGADLKQVIESLRQSGKRMSVEAAVYIAAKICEGLSYAHELTGPDDVPLQIVHRDMSPPNVLITKYGEVKIVDFGLAKATSQLEKSEAGIIKGKFSYLAPEAALGEDVDLRADIFAVGIILWEMLAGRRLFLGETDFQTVKLVQQAKIPSLTNENPGVPKELDLIVQKALARDPNRRYSSARDFGRDLTNFLFTNAKPVSSYDIAEYVRSTMQLRKKKQPESVNLERLIEEELFAFKSLKQDEDGAGGSARANAAPRAAGFEDISHWTDEMGAASSMGFGDLGLDEGAGANGGAKTASNIETGGSDRVSGFDALLADVRSEISGGPSSKTQKPAAAEPSAKTDEPAPPRESTQASVEISSSEILGESSQVKPKEEAGVPAAKASELRSTLRVMEKPEPVPREDSAEKPSPSSRGSKDAGAKKSASKSSKGDKGETQAKPSPKAKSESAPLAKTAQAKTEIAKESGDAGSSKLVLVIVAAALIFAVAWFSGLIPH